MHAFTVRTRTKNENQARFFPFGPREMCRSGGCCAVCFSSTLSFLSLSFSFIEESGFVASRRRRRRSIGGERRWQGGGADGAKGNVVSKYRK